MKRSILISTVLILAVIGAAWAQQPPPEDPAAGEQVIQQGDVMIGGSTSLSFNGTTFNPEEGDSESSTEMHLQAIGSYFVTDGIAIGPEIEIQYESGFQPGIGDNDVFGVLAGAHVGYYLPLNNTFVPYGRLSAGFLFETRDQGDSTGYYLRPRIGLNYFLTEVVALDGSLFYSYSGTTEENDAGDNVETSQSQYGLAFGINLLF